MDSSPYISEDRPKAAILRMEGTNCEQEAFHSLQRSGADPHFVHIKEIEGKKTHLEDFDIIFIPGGFSAGDYIRAGTIFSMRLKKAALKDLQSFASLSKPVIGVCNGFQILTEMGLLPFAGDSEINTALTVTESNRFECRNTFIRLESKNPIFRKLFSQRKSWEVPVAHSEGRITFSSPDILKKLRENDQVVFRYVNPEGEISGYPWNPNGSDDNIAAVSNEMGNVVGLMPHPERIYFPFQCELAGTETTTGKAFFDSIVDYSLGIRAKI